MHYRVRPETYLGLYQIRARSGPMATESRLIGQSRTALITACATAHARSPTPGAGSIHAFREWEIRPWARP